MSAPIRVMVVDDHPMWRDAVARDLAEAGYDVVAAVGEGAQAVRVAAAARPDVVVLDLQLPDLSGVEVIRGLLAGAPGGTRAGPLGQRRAAGRARGGQGRRGRLPGEVGQPDEFLDAVRRTASGDAVFTPGLAGLVLGEFRRLADRPARRHGRARG